MLKDDVEHKPLLSLRVVIVVMLVCESKLTELSFEAVTGIGVTLKVLDPE
jgi:hypothetical protein